MNKLVAFAALARSPSAAAPRWRHEQHGAQGLRQARPDDARLPRRRAVHRARAGREADLLALGQGRRDRGHEQEGLVPRDASRGPLHGPHEQARPGVDTATANRVVRRAPSADATSCSTPASASRRPGSRASRDDDLLADLLAVQELLNPSRRARLLDQLLLGHVRRDLDPVAHAAVDLDHEFERLTLQQRRIRLRPGLLPQPFVPQTRPELLGDVRRIWLKQRHGRFRREPRGRIRRPNARARSRAP